MRRTLAEIRGIVNGEDFADTSREDQDKLIDDLQAMLWDIGLAWDQIAGVDPQKGEPRKYGTPNRRSMTYKCRKLAGFSYP